MSKFEADPTVNTRPDAQQKINIGNKTAEAAVSGNPVANGAVETLVRVVREGAGPTAKYSARIENPEIQSVSSSSSGITGQQPTPGNPANQGIMTGNSSSKQGGRRKRSHRKRTHRKRSHKSR
jgi:hypothetical protein